MEARRAPPVGADTLYGVIGAIAEGPDLDRVLRAVVDLLVQATSCHACFVYLREDDRLRIRAASPVFAHVVGRVSMGLDEGLTGWVARHRRPAFIREAALDDPRMKYVPELEEERFQSMVAVPLVDRQGDVIGVVVLHTEAPREFGQDVLELLVHVASLVVGAIDNARLYDQTQRQVAALSALTELSQELASLTAPEDIHDAGCAGIRRMLQADGCRLLLVDRDGGRTEIAVAGESSDAPFEGRLTTQLMADERALGVVSVQRGHAFSATERQLLEASANHLALALRKAELIERLAAENLVREVFDALERGTPEAAADRARSAGWDPSRPHVAVVAAPGHDDAAASGVLAATERGLRSWAPGALCDIGASRLRALVPVSRGLAGAARSLDALDAELRRIAREVGATFGVSRLRSDLAEDTLSLGEAADAQKVAHALDRAGGVRRFDRLGVYGYLVAHAGSRGPDPVHARALDALAAYDRRRHAELLTTLETYLGSRGAITTTAEALLIHPNTLRQRLRRIEEVGGLDLEQEDLLALELAVKVHRLNGGSTGARHASHDR